MKRKVKRGNGEGSVHRRDSDGRWVGVAEVPGSGRSRRSRKYVYAKTRAEAARKLRDVQARLDAGLPPPDDRMTVGDWLDRWAGDPEAAAGTPAAAGQIGKLAYKTQISYRQVVRDYLRPDWALGTARLTTLNPDRVQRWLDELADRDVPPPTVKYSLDILRIALKAAMRADLIVRENPASLVHAPRWRRRKAKPFTATEAEGFLGAIRHQRLYPLIVLALTAALRRGELLGLTWGNVDLDEGVLHITQQLQRMTGRGLVVSPTKTERSEAPVALPGITVRALQAHRAGLIEERFERGEEWLGAANPVAADAFVFVGELGSPLDPDNVYRAFKGMLKDTGLADRRLHDSRHTTASLLAALGVPPAVAADVLRHSKKTTTLNVYTHSDLRQQREAAAKLDDLLKDVLA